MSPSDRLVPQVGEVYLDHVGWFVRDVARASAAFERLGFVLTPFVVSRNADPAGGPPKPAGTGNRCAMLRRGYLELIAAIDGVDTPLAVQHRAAASRHVGIHVIAFTVAETAAAYARLKASGFEPGEPVLLRRPISAMDGREAEAAFTVLRIPAEKMPEGRIQILVQETPHLVWQPQLIARDNGITALGGVLVCVDDPAEAAMRYGRFVGRTPQLGRDYATLLLDRGRLGFATPMQCAALLPGVRLPDSPVIAALALVADDVGVVRRFCRDHGIARWFDDAGRFCISHEYAVGTALLIHGPADAWPPDM